MANGQIFNWPKHPLTLIYCMGESNTFKFAFFQLLSAGDNALFCRNLKRFMTGVLIQLISIYRLILTSLVHEDSLHRDCPFERDALPGHPCLVPYKLLCCMLL